MSKLRGWHPDHIKQASEIVRRLRLARRLYDYTQAKVAIECGHSQSWISEVEKGKKDITLSDACQLANIYGLELKLCDKG